MARYTKPRYTEQLSPVFCTHEMKEMLVKYAEKHNMSLSEIQRQAVTLFLDKNYSDPIENNSDTIVQEVAS